MFKRYVYIEGLTSLHGSKGKYLINNDGQVKDIKGNDLAYRRDDEGHLTVHCLGWDGEREYRVIDLVAIQFKSLYIPETDYGKVIAFVIDGNPENTHARNIGYRFAGGKLEYGPAPGFYYVPGMTSLAVDIEGRMLSVITSRHLKANRSLPNKKRNIRGGYATVRVVFRRGAIFGFLRHRAMCLVFKEYPDNVDTLVVNHINGVPGDDRPENLEWITRGENNRHAYETDLKNQHLRVLSRDVMTGEVVEYYSIAECARKLGWSVDETIRFRIYQCPFGQVFQDGKQFKLKSDPRDWVIPDDPEHAIKDAQMVTPVKVRNCITLEEMEAESISEAGRLTGILSSVIRLRLTQDKRFPLAGYQFKYADDVRPWQEFTKEELERSLKPNSFGVDARNHLTGEISSFSSMRKARERTGCSYLHQVLRDGKQPLLSNGWQVKYNQDPWEEVKDFEETLYRAQREVSCRNEATGAILIADSAQSISEILRVDPKMVRKAAFTRGNMIYKGHRFRLGVAPDPWPATTLPSQQGEVT